MTAGDGQLSAPSPPQTEAPATAPKSAAPPASAGVPASPGLPALARILGSVVAPTTLLTALLYYFGYMHAWFFFGYFGLNSTTLGFSTVDYLMRSVDALFIPVTSAAILGLLALWGNALLVPRLRTRRNQRTNTLIVRGIAAGGVILGVTSLVLTFKTVGDKGSLVALAPVGFGLGVLVTAYAVHLDRVLVRRQRGDHAASGWAQATEWAIVFALVGISLFAAATDYAGAVGESRAQLYVAGLANQPGVALYSEKDIALTQPGVTQSRCRDPQAAYQFRYDGLALMLESGGKYVLIPRSWRWGDPALAVIVLAQSDTFRLQFYSTGIPAPSAC
jgi:hypothetical protein